MLVGSCSVSACSAAGDPGHYNRLNFNWIDSVQSGKSKLRRPGRLKNYLSAITAEVATTEIELTVALFIGPRGDVVFGAFFAIGAVGP